MLAGRDEVRLAGLAADLGAQTFALDASNVRQVEIVYEAGVEYSGL